MRTLITGAAGFIGSNLCRRLVEMGHSVTAVDDFSTGFTELVPHGITLIADDFQCSNIFTLIVLQRFDVVVHLAARPRVSYSIENPFETNHNNVNKTLNLLGACKGNVKRFVFASSSSVYGGSQRMRTRDDGSGGETLPSREVDDLDPRSPYALQKMTCEQWLKQYRMHYGLESVALRFFNVFGPGSLPSGAYSMALTSWLTAIKQDRACRFDGDGAQTRDACYIDNAVDALVAAIESPRDFDAAPINIACGRSVSNNEVFDHLERRYPCVVKQTVPERRGDVKHTLADISRARELLGYEPKVQAMEGVEMTCEWFDQNWSWIRCAMER